MKLFLTYIDNAMRRGKTFTTNYSVLKTLREQVNNLTEGFPENLSDKQPANQPDKKVKHVSFDDTPKIEEFEVQEGAKFRKLPPEELKEIRLSDKKELLNSRPNALLEDKDFEQGELKTEINDQLIDLGFTKEEIQLKVDIFALNKECKKIAENPYLTKHQEKYIRGFSAILNNGKQTDTQKLVSLRQKLSNDECLGERFFRLIDRVENALFVFFISPNEEQLKQLKEAETMHIKLFQSYKVKFTNVTTADINEPEQVDQSRPK